MRNRIWCAVVSVSIAAVLFLSLAATADARHRGGNRQLVCHQKDDGTFKWLWLKERAARAHLEQHEHDQPGQPGRLDLDRDGWGRDWIINNTCPSPWIADIDHGGDCNDNPRRGGFAVNPGMEEIHGNGIDDDCNPDTPDNPPEPTEPPEGYCALNGPCEESGGLCDEMGSGALVWEGSACFPSKRPGMSNDDSCICR